MTLSKQKRAAQMTAAAIRSTLEQNRLLRKDNVALIEENKKLKAQLAAMKKQRTQDDDAEHIVTPSSTKRVPRARKQQASA